MYKMFYFAIIVCIAVACNSENKAPVQNDTFGTSNGSKKTDISSKPSPSNGEKKSFTVNSLKDMVSKAAPNTTIQLKSGDYELDDNLIYFMTNGESRVIDKRKEETRFQGGSIYIGDMANFEIIGEDGTRIFSNNAESIPFYVMKGENLLFNNLNISTTSDGSKGSVVYLYGTKNVLFKDCIIEGGGAKSLDLIQVEDFVFDGGKIMKSAGGMMQIINSKNAIIRNAELRNNICGRNCIVVNGDQNEVLIENTKIIDNKRNPTATGAKKVISDYGKKVKLNKCQMWNNAGFEKLGLPISNITDCTIDDLELDMN